jgi:plasmid stabilization system protein ParE
VRCPFLFIEPILKRSGHIGGQSRASVSFVREVREHFSKIAAAPQAYTARPELGDGVRSCTHGRYLILFIPDEGEVLIARIVHGARNLGLLDEDA